MSGRKCSRRPRDRSRRSRDSLRLPMRVGRGRAAAGPRLAGKSRRPSSRCWLVASPLRCLDTRRERASGGARRSWAARAAGSLARVFRRRSSPAFAANLESQDAEPRPSHRSPAAEATAAEARGGGARLERRCRSSR
ncbi:hypothetical protein TGPRC2_426750 [Toxoplasma gondii TgCatPRC2]|uniref:Uncharacterized protein n=1 Tax=Toxoplasma gondii TgCatPRC2 TaxID=1130821 RepID=A0A151H2N0_TOXGO|nr:hypothetical protein TGPRC2_426750 [Toxoplasma gondii TgCatPRC2]